MVDQSQSNVRMRTRSQGFQAASNGGGVNSTSAPGGSGTEQPESGSGERSSMMAPNPTQTQPRLSATVRDIVEPVISASDRRIKSFLAQTSMGKMMLDNHIKEMTKMA